VTGGPQARDFTFVVAIAHIGLAFGATTEVQALPAGRWGVITAETPLSPLSSSSVHCTCRPSFLEIRQQRS
jgi:hypothetical protein